MATPVLGERQKVYVRAMQCALVVVFDSSSPILPLRRYGMSGKQQVIP
jgi:hypothetical protein